MSRTAPRCIPERRWPRRILIAINLIVALTLISTGTVYGYARYRIDSIHSVAAAHLTSQQRDGENILLIGNETRAGLGTSQYGNPALLSGSLSDVIMVLHLNPTKGTASILSIPRDLFVPQPAGSPVGPYQKVDAALNDGAQGPDNLIETITDDFGIPINHYVELNFNGFQGTVNALGGIKMNFPERVYDAYSALNISQTGCQELNGTEALALVRSRHLQYDPPGVSPYDQAAWPYDPESDLSRIVRDHTFMRVLASTAESEGLTNPIKANAFLGSIINQITVDPGLKNQMVSLAVHYRHLDPSTSPETTLPVTQVGGSTGYDYNGSAIGDVDFPDQPADNQAIAAWDGEALPSPVDPQSVQVTNITGESGLAATTQSALSADHLTVSGVSTGTVPAPTTETLVQYHPGQLADGLGVSRYLSGAVMMQSASAVASGMVNVDIGTSVSVIGTTAPAAGSATPSTQTTAASAPTATTVPTPGGQAASSASDQQTPYDPRPC